MSQLTLRRAGWDFPGGPEDRTPCFHCRGPRLDPWLGKYPACYVVWPKKKRGRVHYLGGCNHSHEPFKSGSRSQRQRREEIQSMRVSGGSYMKKDCGREWRTV